MALLSVAVAVPLRASAQHLAAVHQVMQLAVSLGSIGLGLAMVSEIGWLPRWLGA
jgi:hypothetical protein